MTWYDYFTLFFSGVFLIIALVLLVKQIITFSDWLFWLTLLFLLLTFINLSMGALQ